MEELIFILLLFISVRHQSSLDWKGIKKSSTLTPNRNSIVIILVRNIEKMIKIGKWRRQQDRHLCQKDFKSSSLSTIIFFMTSTTSIKVLIDQRDPCQELYILVHKFYLCTFELYLYRNQDCFWLSFGILEYWYFEMKRLQIPPTLSFTLLGSVFHTHIATDGQ